MERIKEFFSFFAYKSPLNYKKEPIEHKFDHIVTIEETEGRTEITRTDTVRNEKLKKQRRLGFLADLLFCTLITLLWVSTFSLYVRYSVAKQSEKLTHDYFYFGYFIVVVIVSVAGIYFESLVLRGFDRFSPKVAVVVRKGQMRRSYVLRLRIAGIENKEFIETELDEDKLTLENVLELCCKELSLEKERILRLRKIPETKIRSDADVKRFRRLEYLEVIADHKTTVSRFYSDC